MDLVDGLFDGKSIILKDQTKISLSEIKRARIEVLPYVIFPISMEDEQGEMKKTEAEILYPHTVEERIDESALVYGKKRATRIMHYVPFGASELKRKPDLRNPHTVRVLGYREIIIEKKDGSELRVSFDGNCYHVPKGVTSFSNGEETILLEEFYDRPSELANIIKKAGIEVYSK